MMEPEKNRFDSRAASMWTRSSVAESARLLEVATVEQRARLADLQKTIAEFESDRGKLQSTMNMAVDDSEVIYEEILEASRAALPPVQTQFRSINVEPPKGGWTVIAVFVPTDMLDAYVGDIEERFGRYALERGRKSALVWYWVEVTRTVAARAWPLIKRLAKIADLFRKMSGG